MQTHDWAPVFGRLIEKERLSGDHLIIIALVRASHTTEWVFDFEKTAARRGWQQIKNPTKDAAYCCQVARRLLSTYILYNNIKISSELKRLLSRAHVNYEHLQKFP
jgi:hypothetical protein